jgi:hypothetical protein
MGPFSLYSLMGIEGNGLFINFFFFLLLPKFPLVFVKSSYKNRKPLQEYCHLVKQKHLHLFLFFNSKTPEYFRERLPEKGRR